MTYSATQIAHYIVSKCIDDNCPITNLQLQNILYYIQIKYLKNNELAFYDDIEAWQFGAVIPSVYYKYCGFGVMPITLKLEVNNIDSSDANRFNTVINEKRKLFLWDISDEIYKSRGAWSKAYKNGIGNKTVIPISLIQENC